jgi:hypothetical protein
LLNVLYESGRRVVAEFSPFAGATGMALGVAAWCYQHLGRAMPGVEPFENEKEMIDGVKSLLQQVADKRGKAGVHLSIFDGNGEGGGVV